MTAAQAPIPAGFATVVLAVILTVSFINIARDMWRNR